MTNQMLEDVMEPPGEVVELLDLVQECFADPDASCAFMVAAMLDKSGFPLSARERIQDVGWILHIHPFFEDDGATPIPNYFHHDHLMSHLVEDEDIIKPLTHFGMDFGGEGALSINTLHRIGEEFMAITVLIHNEPVMKKSDAVCPDCAATHAFVSHPPGSRTIN